MQRKRTTIQDYRIMLAAAPRPVLRRDRDRASSRRTTSPLHRGQAPRRARHQDDHEPPQLRPRRVRVRGPARLGRREPVAMADRPPSPPADPDIRFLDREELEALLRAAARRRPRSDRSGALADRRDDRPSAGRARRPALARRRLDRPRRPRAAQLLARPVDDAQEPPLEPRRADGRPRRSRARAALHAVGVHRTTTTSCSATRRPAGRTTRARCRVRFKAALDAGRPARRCASTTCAIPTGR